MLGCEGALAPSAGEAPQSFPPHRGWCPHVHVLWVSDSQDRRVCPDPPAEAVGGLTITVSLLFIFPVQILKVSKDTAKYGPFSSGDTFRKTCAYNLVGDVVLDAYLCLEVSLALMSHRFLLPFRSALWSCTHAPTPFRESLVPSLWQNAKSLKHQWLTFYTVVLRTTHV